MTELLYIRPFSWKLDSRASEPVVQLFGRTVANQTIYVRIASKASSEAAVWKAHNLCPYDLVKITRYSPLPPGYTSFNFNVCCSENHLEPVDEDVEDLSDPPRVFYWDLEVYASVPGRFPQASDPNDEIFAVSIRTESEEVNEYVIITKPVGPMDDVVVISAANERDLLTKFFALFVTFSPDYHCHFNGDVFDLPYLLERARVCKFDVPYLSRVRAVPMDIITCEIPTPYGTKAIPTLSIPGIESVDVLHYSRAFYPHLPNHRLDTMAKHMVGVGKYDLSIADMMEAVRSNDSAKLTEVVKYSIGDVRVLSDTWGAMDGENVLLSVSNKLRVSIDTLLRSPHLIEAIIFSLDSGDLKDRNYHNSILTHTREAQPGVYRKIYTSDYSELYAIAMQSSSDPITAELGRRLVGSPPNLIFAVFHSRFVCVEEILPRFNDLIKFVAHEPGVISVTDTMVWHYHKFYRPGVVVTNYYPIWIRLNDVSPVVDNQHYIAVTDRKEFESSGRCELARPSSGVVRKSLVAYMLSVDLFMPPDVRTFPLEDFALTVRCSSNVGYVAGTLEDILLHQCEAVGGFQDIQYVNTTEGPMVLARARKEIIDYPSYAAAAMDAIQQVRRYHQPL